MTKCCADSLERNGASCVFGCNHVIGDSGICPNCRDHSANSFECDTCGKHWEKWDAEWENV